MSTAYTVTATFTATTGSCTSSGSTTLANIVTSSSGALTSNSTLTSSCPADTLGGGAVTGICYGNYAVQVNNYGTPPASTNFQMWSQSASCWGITTTSANTGLTYWNAPLVTRGFSFGYDAPLTSTGGLKVSSLNTTYAGSGTHCPTSGTANSVCVKWVMSVPGVSTQSSINTASTTYTNWDALLDIYFHAASSATTPTSSTNVSFDLQVYQMVMDWQAGGNPNWASYIIGTYTTKTIGGVTYLVTVNAQDPGTMGGSTGTWVGSGGTLNTVALFVLPTYPTSTSSKSYLWGSASVTHDVGGIIAWLSQTQTIGAQTGIFDDAGHLLYDNARNANVTTPLIDPSYYLTGLNPGFEVVQASTNGGAYPNNSVYNTTNYWVALPGETVGN